MKELTIKYCKIEIEENEKEKKLEEIRKIIPKTFEFASKYKSETAKYQTLLSKLMVIRNLGCSEDDIYFNKLNKPYVKDKPFFNISHSKDYIVYIESESEIGIDIEYISEKNLSILDYAFTEEERDYIVAGSQCSPLRDECSPPQIEREIRFTYLWTIKEALFKASGSEVFAEPKKIVVENISDKISERYNAKGLNDLFENLDYIKIYQEYLGKKYNIYGLKFLDYVVSVASEEDYDKIKFKKVEI